MEEPAIVVGQVTRAHGIHGEVRVRNRSDNPDRWVAGAVVHGPDGRAFTVTAVRTAGDRLLVRFEGVDDRTAAEALHGAELTVPASWLPTLPEGEWWPHELEGCEVRTEGGRHLGMLREVMFNPANDIWVVMDEDGGETLVPALRAILVHVDVAGRSIVVKDVPGITVPDEDEDER